MVTTSLVTTFLPRAVIEMEIIRIFGTTFLFFLIYLCNKLSQHKPRWPGMHGTQLIWPICTYIEYTNWLEISTSNT